MNRQESTRSLVIERELHHSPAKVWRALTEGHLIEEWLMKNDFKAIAGHRFTLRADPTPQWNGIVQCEVLTVAPQHTLSYTWTSSGARPGEGLNTVVTFTLTPTASGTLLRMEQSGFRPQDEFNFKGASYGWERFLSQLDRVAGDQA